MGGDENTAKLRESFPIPPSTPRINLLSILAFWCMLYANQRENGWREQQRPNLPVYVGDNIQSWHRRYQACRKESCMMMYCSAMSVPGMRKFVLRQALCVQDVPDMGSS